MTEVRSVVFVTWRDFRYGGARFAWARNHWGIEEVLRKLLTPTHVELRATEEKVQGLEATIAHLARFSRKRVALDDVLNAKWFTAALSDPGRFVPRKFTRNDFDGRSDPEPLHLWQARALRHVLTCEFGGGAQ